MKLRPIPFANAYGLGILALYVLCYIAYAIAPEASHRVAGTLLHMDMSSLPVQLGGAVLVQGVIGWYLIGAVGGWLIATLYNRQSSASVTNG